MNTEMEMYYATSEWNDFANSIRDRDKVCCVCGDPGTDVHHWTYRNFQREKMDDCGFVCRKCHTAITYHQRMSRMLDGMYRESIDEIAQRNKEKYEAEKRNRKEIEQRLIDAALKKDISYGKESTLNLANTSTALDFVKSWLHENVDDPEKYWFTSSVIKPAIEHQRILLIERSYKKGVKKDKLIELGISKKFVDKYYGNQKAIDDHKKLYEWREN